MFYLVLFLILNFILDISAYLYEDRNEKKYSTVHPAIIFFQLFFIIGVGITLLFKIDLNTDLLNSLYGIESLTFETSYLSFKDIILTMFTFFVIFIVFKERTN